MGIKSPNDFGRRGIPEGLPGAGSPHKEKPIASPQKGGGPPGSLPEGGSPAKGGPIASPTKSWRGQIPDAGAAGADFHPPS